MEELISVILNVYNGEKFINKCIDSIINQTYKNLEIIIIDDGSTDNTLKICRSYTDPRIKIITQENQGLSISRNVGIDNSTGSYLYFVDVDDYIEEDAIEYLYNLAKEHDSDITTCIPLDRYDYETKIVNPKEKVEVLDNIEMLKRVLLIKYREGTIWNKLLKKELFDNIRFEKRIVNDVVVVYKLVLIANKIVYSNQIKYNYYRHDASIISQKKTKYMIDMYNAIYERYNYINELYPNMKENKVCLLEFIVNTYNTKDQVLIDYLNSEDAIGIYKSIFSMKLLNTKIPFRTKIRLLLFKISPKLYLKVIRFYLKLRYKR